MNQEKIVKEIRFLKIYAALVTLSLGVVFFTAATSDKIQKFKEINVERINVVEKDGKLKMVISNAARQHPGQIDGVYYKEREGKRPAGMIFFSTRGDEIGGLIFSGDDGKGQYGGLTFDKFRGDQTVQIAHMENKEGDYFAGLVVNDQNMPISDYLAKLKEIEKLPSKEEQAAAKQKLQENGGANRMFMGKSQDKKSVIGLNDAKGKTRIEISVEANGNPKLNFLDENGKIFYSLPEDLKTKK